MSHAVCVRGLKHLPKGSYGGFLIVARRVRAWIETHIYSLLQQKLYVARRVRAWIET